MRALTLWQPWAFAIAHLGKDVENRTWKPPGDIQGQRIAIHAGKRIDWDATWALHAEGHSIPLKPITGAVVAVATVSGFVTENHGTRRRSPWFAGAYGWCLDDVIVLPDPVVCRGAQRLWALPSEVEGQVLTQVIGQLRRRTA